MSSALYINGVFEENLVAIEKAQKAAPGRQFYLQPYSDKRIILLAKQRPTRESPITLYFSLTDSLGYISYTAKCVGWQDKRVLAKDETELARLDDDIKTFQPKEIDIYLTHKGKNCVNLISVIDVKRLKPWVPVSRLIKVSDAKPHKTKTQAGNWSEVQEQMDRAGLTAESEKDDVEAWLQTEVVKSRGDHAAARQERLANAPKVPGTIQVISRAFLRNPDVIEEALIRANGVCEECRAPAPFRRAIDDTPYLEVHHRQMLSAGGEDTVANAVAVCPNCHQKLHFGKTDALREEVVLEVGSEGGSLTLFRVVEVAGARRFRFGRNEMATYDMLSDEDRDSIGVDQFVESNYADSLEDALKLLDRYPWFRLVPLEIHPEFFNAILLEVRRRGGDHEENRWRRKLGTF